MFKYELNLRKIEKKDLKKLFLLKTEVFNNHHRVAIINESDQEMWFESLDKDVYYPKNLVLIGSNDSHDVGVVFFTNINYINKTSDIGIDIYKKHRNKGYGTNLLKSAIDFSKDILHLRKLSCEILEYNLASSKIFEKNNFVKEGHRKGHIYKNGNYIDSIIWALFI